jgi:hypothetical protein
VLRWTVSIVAVDMLRVIIVAVDSNHRLVVFTPSMQPGAHEKSQGDSITSPIECSSPVTALSAAPDHAASNQLPIASHLISDKTRAYGDDVIRFNKSFLLPYITETYCSV